MSVAHNAVASIAMLVIGAVKTWLHVGSVSVLSLATCSGKAVSLPFDAGGMVDNWHCWGCYLFMAGLILAARIIWLTWSPRHAMKTLSY